MRMGQVLQPLVSRLPRPLRRFVELLQFTRDEYERDQARYFALAMVYYAFVSFEPMLFLLVTSLGLMLRSPRFSATVEPYVHRFVETSLGSDLTPAIEKA